MRWVDGIIDSMDMSLSKLWEIVENREDSHVAVHGIAKSQTQLRAWTTIGHEVGTFWSGITAFIKRDMREPLPLFLSPPFFSLFLHSLLPANHVRIQCNWILERRLSLEPISISFLNLDFSGSRTVRNKFLPIYGNLFYQCELRHLVSDNNEHVFLAHVVWWLMAVWLWLRWIVTDHLNLLRIIYTCLFKWDPG